MRVADLAFAFAAVAAALGFALALAFAFALGSGAPAGVVSTVSIAGVAVVAEDCPWTFMREVAVTFRTIHTEKQDTAARVTLPRARCKHFAAHNSNK